MGAGFTPGPWTHEPDWPTDVICAPNAPHAPSVATIDIGPGDRKECEANARLIAAAPELYAGCETALNALFAWANEKNIGRDDREHRRAIMETVKAALAKARGDHA